MAIAFRTARRGWVRKLGAVAFLAASYALFFFLTDQWWGGVIGVVVWFFLPWVELLTRVKRMKLPMDNRLRHQTVPNTSFFPHAQQMLDTMESEGFDYAGDCCWEWSGMKQHYRMYYHQETRTMATLCLCEQSDVGGRLAVADHQLSFCRDAASAAEFLLDARAMHAQLLPPNLEQSL